MASTASKYVRGAAARASRVQLSALVVISVLPRGCDRAIVSDSSAPSMLGVPVACDRRAGGHPRIVLGANVLEETVEGARSARPSDNAAMKSDRHHSPAFRAQL